MKKNLLIILCALSFTFIPTVASAAGSIFDLDTTEKRFYWGMNYGSVKDIDFDIATFVLGWDMNNYYSFEVHAGKSNTAEEEIGGVNRTFEADYIASAFFRMNLRREDYTLYLLAGASTISLKGQIQSVTLLEDTFTEAGFGGGFELYGSRNTALTISWIRYLHDIEGTGTDITTTNIGFVHHFDWPTLGSRY